MGEMVEDVEEGLSKGRKKVNDMMHPVEEN